MRFTPDGPSIPNELLTARDEGRVAFFCGAGVSLARARLPDFYRLTSTILDELGADEKGQARRLMRTAEALRRGDILPNSGVQISADQVFAFLEQEFTIDDVRTEVAKALRPRNGVDLSAHRTLIDLSRGSDGSVRLVTTNFDRLFEAAAPDLPVWAPPSLPDLRRSEAFEGIVHLHGSTNADYTGIAGDAFVVSSADFGRAYLMDGWAANFMRHLLQRYQLVFVGYSADDPPIRYLLEALGRTATSTAGLYAFDCGTGAEVQSRWGTKGVQPIAVDPTVGYDALWVSLEAWAVKARDPAGWTASVIESARRGPTVLAPHERGQVAHLVSTVEGAQAFRAADPPAPAEWLCVFDPVIRFGMPGKIGRYFEPGETVDPFDLYGIDDDPVPMRIAADDHYAKREVPEGVWSAFKKQAGDVMGDHLAVFIGDQVSEPPQLSRRLWNLGVWLSRVSHEPAAVWWVGKKGMLHPTLQNIIQLELHHDGNRFGDGAKRAWQLNLAAWADGRPFRRRDWYDLERGLSRDGWSISTASRIASTVQPRLAISSSYSAGPLPPSTQTDIAFHELVHIDVEYPEWEDDIDVPPEHLEGMVRAIRWMLERATVLEKEIGGYGLRLERPLVPDPDVPHNEISYGRGLDHLLARYVKFYKLLDGHSKASAERERAAWPVDDCVFARLRMWAAGQRHLTSPGEAGRRLIGLSAEAFWDGSHQRDLLVAIEARWVELPQRTQLALVRRIIKGPKRWSGIKKGEFSDYRARSILERVDWFRRRGINLPFDVGAVDDIRRSVPDWREEHATGAAASHESRGGYVVTDPTPDVLLNEPLSTLIDVAERSRGRDPKSWLRRNDPFQGYVQIKPLRALAALIMRSKTGTFPSQYWRTFLHSEIRKSDKPRMSGLIAGRLGSLAVQDLASITLDVCQWLRGVASPLFNHQPDTFHRLWSVIIGLLGNDENTGLSTLVRSSKRHDWLSEGINAPSGCLCEVLFQHPMLSNLRNGDGLPSDWKIYIADLLSLHGKPRLYVVAVLGERLSWLYSTDPAWAKEHLFAEAEFDVAGFGSALFDGFIHRPRVSVPLYMRMKPLIMAQLQDTTDQKDEALAGLLLAGWGGVWDDPEIHFISDREMRTSLLNGSDQYRQRVLWLLRSWAKEKNERWRPKILIFLQFAWPRQRAVNGSAVTGGICSLLIASGDDFPEAVRIILPRIAPFDKGASMFLHQLEDFNEDLDEGNDSLVKRFPRSVLDLLEKVLPVDVRLWPHNTSAILKLIGQQDPALATDQRRLTLLRRMERGA